MASSITVILPQERKRERNYPVLYLLHGLSDDHTIWTRRTSIERYADQYGIAVVMPEVHRSFYADMKQGLKYWTYISEELPELVRSFFPISDRREDNFVAGLSMGGYGAFKVGLNHPERYAAAASLSGALDMGYWNRPDIYGELEYRMAFGDPSEYQGSENDVFHQASLLAQSGKALKLYQCCGTEDFLYADNQRFLEHARSLGLDLTYEEEPGGHSWEYWDMKIKRVLSWLPIQR